MPLGPKSLANPYWFWAGFSRVLAMPQREISTVIYHAKKTVSNKVRSIIPTELLYGFDQFFENFRVFFSDGGKHFSVQDRALLFDFIHEDRVRHSGFAQGGV